MLFAAAQAAQKQNGKLIQFGVRFAAAQAAQKSGMAMHKKWRQFAAAQAAQKVFYFLGF